MAKLQISRLATGVRITDLDTGAYEDVPVAAAERTERPAKAWLDEAPVIEADEPELSGRLHYRA